MDTFSDLPDALVKDLLAKAVPVASAVGNNLRVLGAERQALRNEARRLDLIQRKADLDVTREPSVAGIDGSYQIHRLTAVDLCASAAVAVEGTSKEATRHWPQPYHEMWVDSVPHGMETTGILRGIMVSMELNLAGQAPHDLVLLDGSFSSLVIYLNQALTSLGNCAEQLRSEFVRRWQAGILGQLKSLLKSDRTVAIPKFTSRNELRQIEGINPSVEVDGKTLGTLILEPGEYTSPLPALAPNETYHLPSTTSIGGSKMDFCSEKDMKEINSLLQELQVVYFRPYGWLPALRLELTGMTASSRVRLSMALEGITRQFFSPAAIEPYPLFIADRMVKSLGAGVAVIEQAVVQQVVGDSADLETTMLCLQNYRTEGGRGGV